MAQLSDTNAGRDKSTLKRVFWSFRISNQIMTKISLAGCKRKLLSTNPVSLTVVFLSWGTNKKIDWDRSIKFNKKTYSFRPRQVWKIFHLTFWFLGVFELELIWISSANFLANKMSAQRSSWQSNACLMFILLGTGESISVSDQRRSEKWTNKCEQVINQSVVKGEKKKKRTRTINRMMEGNIRHVQQLVRSILQRFYIDEMKDLKSNHLNSFLENQHQKQFHACLILLLAKPIIFFTK